MKRTPSPPQVSGTSTFWEWFAANERALFETASLHFDGIADPIWEDLAERIKAIHPSLSYLVSDEKAVGRRELIITAQGDRRAVPYVTALHSEAPQLPRWLFLKYRPRWDTEDWELAYEGRPVDRQQIEFVLFTQNHRPSLMLFVRGYTSDGDEGSWYRNALVVLVDHLLGEEDSMWLEEILVFPWEDPTPARRYPVSLLSVAFDQMKQKLPAQPV